MSAVQEPVPPFVCKAVNKWKATKKGELSLKAGVHVKVTEVSSDRQRWYGEYDEGKVGWFPKTSAQYVGDWAAGAHTMYMHHFNSPTWCTICQQFIWGLGKQGLRCTLCKTPVHKKCARRLTNNCHEGQQEVAAGVIAPKRSFSMVERGKLPPSLRDSLSGSSSSSSSSSKKRASTVVDSAADPVVSEIMKMTELVDWLERAIRAKRDNNALKLKTAITSMLDAQKQADPAQPYGVFLPLKDRIDAALKSYKQTVGMRIVEANIPLSEGGAKNDDSDESSSHSSDDSYDDDSLDEESGFDGYNTFGMNQARLYSGI